VLKSVNYVAFSEYCVKSGERGEECCYRTRIYTALVLYVLVHYGDWASTKQLYLETRVPYDYLVMALRKLERHGLVERVYVPGARGTASLWRVGENILNGYDKKRVLELLKKHIEMCLASTESSEKLSTATAATADVVIELPRGSIALSRSEYRELFVLAMAVCSKVATLLATSLE
jgi:DNA-binding IscR family transcriptional regulator